MREEPAQVVFVEFGRVPFAVKQNIVADSSDVGALGAGAQIAHADGVAQAGEKTWPFHGISPPSVEPCEKVQVSI
jgi:hypothetical protein